MKALYASLFFLLMSVSFISAQDKVSVSKKDSFNSLTKTESISKFILTDFNNELPAAAKEFLDDNKQFLTYTLENGVLSLFVKLEKNEKVVYQKLFSQLGIHQVEIVKGKDKGLYTIEDFLNKYNL